MTKFKGVLLDIDNTLYAYEPTHEAAIEMVVQTCVSRYGIFKEDFNEAFSKARSQTHKQLAGTASSHNRLLYFQRTLELLNFNALEVALELYRIYWDTFMDHIQVYEGVYELLEMYKDRICLVTDLTADIQHKKVLKLGLYRYTKHMVTSEEAGREKPESDMFVASLLKLGLSKEDVCMIGDSFSKDIMGAHRLGIKSIWLNQKQISETYDSASITEVHSFKQILPLL